MDVVVTEVPDRQRYEASVGGQLAGFAAYVNNPGLVVFTHTEVDKAFAGQGVGSQLARVALDATRGRGAKVLPLCPFIRGWIDRHPDYQDLVPAASSM